MLKIRIAETDNFSPKVIEELSQTNQVDLKETNKEELADCFRNYDVFWFRLKFKIEEQDFPENTRCKYILCPVTGLDHIDLDACKRRGIEVISLKGETEFLKNVRATAELTIGLTLSLIRNIPQAIQSVKLKNWDRNPYKGTEIFQKKVGIVGVGRLGSITAKYFQAFGASVYGYDINNFDTNICEPVSSLDDLASMVDILSIHVSYNQNSHHLIHEKVIGRMKKSAILINTSRGSVIEERSLLTALKNGNISGAAIDVIQNEYNIENNMLIKYAQENQNLIITPHIGGNTWESFEKTEMFLVQKLVEQLKPTEIKK